MEAGGRKFITRRVAAIMAGLTGFALPISGLILHVCRHHHAGNSEWFHVHVFVGVIFTLFAGWHAVLNRRALLKYLRPVRKGA